MIFYSDNTVLIRNMAEADVQVFAEGGYLPDGSGAWHGGKPCEPYGTYRSDDDLILYLAKKLR